MPAQHDTPSLAFLYGEKLATVKRRVKQYRRALQMLEEGSHDWHGSSNINGVVEQGKLSPGPRQAMGRGVYMFEGKPNHGYWNEGGFAVPHEALGNAQRIPFHNALGEANILAKSDVPLKPHIDANGVKRHTYAAVEYGNRAALDSLQRNNHVRTLDTDVLNLARRSVSDMPKHHTKAPDGSGVGKLLNIIPDMFQDEAKLDVGKATAATKKLPGMPGIPLSPRKS